MVDLNLEAERFRDWAEEEGHELKHRTSEARDKIEQEVDEIKRRLGRHDESNEEYAYTDEDWV